MALYETGDGIEIDGVTLFNLKTNKVAGDTYAPLKGILTHGVFVSLLIHVCTYLMCLFVGF